MMTHYSEYKCPVCHESWILSMTNYSEKVNKQIKKEFLAHVNSHEELDNEIKRLLRVINYANEPK